MILKTKLPFLGIVRSRRIQQITNRVDVLQFFDRFVNLLETRVKFEGQFGYAFGPVRMEPIEERADQVAQEQKLLFGLHFGRQFIVYEPGKLNESIRLKSIDERFAR